MQKPSSTALTSFTTFVKERFWYIAFFVALASFALAIRNDLIQSANLNDLKGKMKKSLAEEIVRQDAMKNKLKIMNKSSYIELVAREKLGLVKRGEEPYKVINK